MAADAPKWNRCFFHPGMRSRPPSVHILHWTKAIALIPLSPHTGAKMPRIQGFVIVNAPEKDSITT
ncbi:MAG: hypothetical protein RLP02_28165 [Coleofasciculus sp. C2-GNP5-27]